MKIQITRLRQDDLIQTLGFGIVFDRLKKVYEFTTLELPWKENKRQVSCIPSGKYEVEKTQSPKFDLCFRVLNVIDRSNILVHTGNYHYDVLGCILVGRGFTDINKDGYLDVYSSRVTMDHLLEIMPNKFELTIIEI